MSDTGLIVDGNGSRVPSAVQPEPAVDHPGHTITDTGFEPSVVVGQFVIRYGGDDKLNEFKPWEIREFLEKHKHKPLMFDGLLLFAYDRHKARADADETPDGNDLDDYDETPDGNDLDDYDETKSRAFVAAVTERVFNECRVLRGAGQKEYAHQEDNAFSNFEKLSYDLGISREMVLLVYAKKHYDGIVSYVKGHRSQRESVTGRINDLIVYMVLLRAMIEEHARNPETDEDEESGDPDFGRAPNGDVGIMKS